MKTLALTTLCIAGLAGLWATRTMAQGPATPPAAAPAPATETPTFKAGGEEVVLDVVVRDKKGRLVKDLKQSDFTVTDNGEKRDIKSFRLVEGTEAVSSSGARSQLDPLRQVRLITLLFEGLPPEGRSLAKDASLSLLKAELPQNVYIAVMTIDHKLEVIQPFTNDRALLRKGIERATGGAVEFGSDTARVRAQLEQMTGPNQGGGQSLEDQAASMSNGASGGTGAGAAPQGSSAANVAMAQMMLQILHANQEDAATDHGRATIFALLTAVKEQYRLPGRKTLLYFSQGFSIPQGMEEPFKSVISVANRSNVSFYAIDAHGLTTTSSNQDALNGLAGAASASRANSVASGVNVDKARSADRAIDSGRRDTQDVLAQLATNTGGALIANTNDFKAPFKKLSEDIQTYYEISYDPQITNYDGSFRKVAVKTEEADLRVQSRSGYFALPPALAGGGQVVTAFEVPLLKALEEKPMPHSFSFQSAGLHFHGDSGTPTCDVVLDVPLGNLTMQENKTSGGYEGKFAYVVLVKDAQGQIVKKFNDQIPLKIATDKLEAYKASHFVYAEPFDLPPGRYTLESAVLDAGGEKISARKSVFLVPAQNTTLSISSIAVIRNTKQKDGNTKTNDPLVMVDKVITPTVNPTVKKSEMDGLPFYVVIYSDKANTEKPSLRMEFSRDGQLLGGGDAPLGATDPQGRIQYVATAPVSKLEPGNYQVRFVAKQGTETAVESVTFTLEP